METDDFISVFFPYRKKRLDALNASSRQLAHYTDAENAKRILENREVCFRSCLLMNDFQEVEHGRRCLLNAWASEHGVGVSRTGGRLQRVLDRLDTSLLPGLEKRFDANNLDRLQETYMFCLSEHDIDGTEGAHGRLSMWRGYGKQEACALVLNKAPLSLNVEMEVFSAPVLYADETIFLGEFAGFISNLEAYEPFLRNMPKEQLLDTLAIVLNAYVLSTKHPGFKEEQEWRIIYAPWMTQITPNLSPITISGIPQSVFRFKLENSPEDGILGLGPNELLQKMIIGPSNHALTLLNAMAQTMTMAGIVNPYERLTLSGIPVRKN